MCGLGQAKRCNEVELHVEVTSNFLIAIYSAAQIKWNDFLHPITWLFLDRFLIFLHESYRAGKKQAIDTKQIKIGQFV